MFLLFHNLKVKKNEKFKYKLYRVTSLSILNRRIIVPETRETRFLHFMGLFTLVKKRISLVQFFKSFGFGPTNHRFKRFVSLQGVLNLDGLKCSIFVNAIVNVRDPFFVHRF